MPIGGVRNRYSACATAERVIAGQRDLNGYPVHFAVERRGGEVAVLGLVPTADAAQEAVRGLRAALPQARIVDRTVALPSGLKEARADIDVLQVKVGDLTSDTSRRDAALKSGIDGVAGNLKTLQDQVTKANGETQSGIEALRGALAETDKARQADVEVLRAEIARAVAPTARARLETWARTHAIFFSKDTSYRDPILAAAALDELAKLIQGTDVLVRVVGFTDEKGGQERNITLIDDGPGIAPEHHASMFLPFRTLGSGGEGMGSRSCRRCSMPSAEPSRCNRIPRLSAAQPSRSAGRSKLLFDRQCRNLLSRRHSDPGTVAFRRRATPIMVPGRIL